MKFQDKFKPGDIICSDHFHNGLCMVVESSGQSLFHGWGYTCVDLVIDFQKWRAYESSEFKPYNYNWRIATDNDIANYLSRFLHIPFGKVGAYDVELTDDGIRLDDDSDYAILLNAEELAQLGRIIKERVVV